MAVLRNTYTDRPVEISLLRANFRHFFRVLPRTQSQALFRICPPGVGKFGCFLRVPCFLSSALSSAKSSAFFRGCGPAAVFSLLCFNFDRPQAFPFEGGF